MGMAHRKDRASFRYQSKYKPLKGRNAGDDPLLAKLAQELTNKSEERKAAKEAQK